MESMASWDCQLPHLVIDRAYLTSLTLNLAELPGIVGPPEFTIMHIIWKWGHKWWLGACIWCRYPSSLTGSTTPLAFTHKNTGSNYLKKKKKLKQGAILSMGSWAVAQAAHSCIQPCLEVFLVFLVFFNTQMTSLSNMICKSGNWLVFLFLCAWTLSQTYRKSEEIQIFWNYYFIICRKEEPRRQIDKLCLQTNTMFYGL